MERQPEIVRAFGGDGLKQERLLTIRYDGWEGFVGVLLAEDPWMGPSALRIISKIGIGCEHHCTYTAWEHAVLSIAEHHVIDERGMRRGILEPATLSLSA